MTRDPRRQPVQGDRWRTPWGVRTVDTVDPGHVVTMGDGERLSWEDWLWSTCRVVGKGGGWEFVSDGRRTC